MKGGTLKFNLMLSLVLSWLCLASSALASETANNAAVLKDYPLVTYSTAAATPERYNSFIFSVRAALVSKSKGKSNGIPVLLSENDPLAIETYLNITLTNKAGYSVSLKMDVTGAYFTAYVAGKYSCLLKRSGGKFSSATCYSDPWGSSVDTSSSRDSGGGYPAGDVDDLEAAASTWRAKDLDEAVSTLFLYPTSKCTDAELSRAVAACDMMIASAATFPYIQRRMSAGMWDGNGVSDDPSLHGLQARWPTLSTAVQESFQGAFAAPVTVQRSNGKVGIRVDNVRAAMPLVSFLEHDNCKEKAKLPMVIRSVVDEAADDMMGGAAAAPEACSKAEPTMRIIGPEGRCVDVPNNWYYEGKQLQLWSCKSYDDVNQLWTFKRDGTIRSKGTWCLTASSATAADSRVVISSCPPRGAAANDRAVWDVRADGTIALRCSGLVLSVPNSALFAGLTVRRDDRGTGQSWTPTNNTTPLAAPIVGYGDLCLQVDSAGTVSLAACGGDGKGMSWSLYPDGSVRPPAWLFFQWRCLAADASGRVSVNYCDGSGSACERWVFRSDGTILNTGTGNVLDARPSATKSGCYDVVVSPARKGRATQQWAVML
ncbi:Ricin [Dichanthelium oligosanthes]|uniref:Ribosome-inactivating protein n=1 Tax=Dichanthelium oligosanthes TaxID=888268 RepID=A0A1E5UR27_9POAL|nr:Ricin [Dichanthelium oligosanthes]